jgi:hypothetical protein
VGQNPKYSERAILVRFTSDSAPAVLRALQHRAKRVGFRFGRHLHESPKRSIREIETHEVCLGRETAPGFFMSASLPLVLFPVVNKLNKRSAATSASPPAGTIEEWNHETVRGPQGRAHGGESRAQAPNAFFWWELDETCDMVQPVSRARIVSGEGSCQSA